MDNLFKVFLIIHITGGTIGLLGGTFIMIAKKGDKIHKLVGKIFAISMLGSGLSSFVLATIHRNDFLFAVGIFTIYLVGTGWQYLSIKNISNGQKVSAIDRGLQIFMILGSIAFLIMGIWNIIEKEYFGIVILIFAWRGFSFVWQDLKTYKGQITTKNYWLVFHLQRMIGTYIASLTAFAVVNAPNRLSFLPWILPAILFVPLIIKWTKKYRINLTSE